MCLLSWSALAVAAILSDGACSPHQDREEGFASPARPGEAQRLTTVAVIGTGGVGSAQGPKLAQFGPTSDSAKSSWTIIGVRDVATSFAWYQSLLGLPESAPAHDDFGQIVDTDGTVLLCVHERGALEHPSLTGPNHAELCTNEFSLRDPDGYFVTISALSAA